MTIQFGAQKVLGSNLGSTVGYSDSFRDFPQAFKGSISIWARELYYSPFQLTVHKLAYHFGL